MEKGKGQLPLLSLLLKPVSEGEGEGGGRDGGAGGGKGGISIIRVPPATTLDNKCINVQI